MTPILRRFLQVQLFDITDTHYQYTVHGTDFDENFDIRRNEIDTNSGKSRMMDFIAEKLAQFEEALSKETKEIYSCDEDFLYKQTKES